MIGNCCVRIALAKAKVFSGDSEAVQVQVLPQLQQPQQQHSLSAGLIERKVFPHPRVEDTSSRTLCLPRVPCAAPTHVREFI